MTEKTRHEEIADQQMLLASELRAKFFFHWSLLSGATLTLIFPLILELRESNKELLESSCLKIALFLLITSLILSSVRNFFAAQMFNKMAMANFTKDIKNLDLKKLSKFQKTIEFIAIFSYTTSLILLIIFINKSFLS